MPESNSLRHQLPYLFVAQAQKEVTHNEALARIDALLHPAIIDRLVSPPSLLLADAGKCWLVDANSAGEWQSKANQIAVWIGGSWRYIVPIVGMRVRHTGANSDLVWTGIQWVIPPVIPNPQSGSVIDIEARAAIAALSGHFRMIGQVT